ncbi:unnamed protein product [Didymodactylos carnosus]|uniref:Helix-turn-helix domain-containing protein n=1 Tax=Didymodactylos carnosus TaxID=1234261 RepID=A0A815RM30_9BILA|nr:unnamed protein product [Didymodactylos carnosus]CAF1478887.1 unnamed protein product [Didymodactylos carnosus]CAF3723284.1 unnamed protein product [Didymodactylos carnosus]CAF4344380.1 unnamed protein product [Didymodactylos carnosus]
MECMFARYQKIGLINSLVVRALRICSNNVLLNDELKFLRDVLNANGYPIKLIERTTKHTIHKEKQNDQQSNMNKNQQRNNDTNDKEMPINIVLSYLEHMRTLNHSLNFNEPSILSFEINGKKREIKETLLTKKFQHWAFNEI